jgi:hypothetical protein
MLAANVDTQSWHSSRRFPMLITDFILSNRDLKKDVSRRQNIYNVYIFSEY